MPFSTDTPVVDPTAVPPQTLPFEEEEENCAPKAEVW